MIEDLDVKSGSILYYNIIHNDSNLKRFYASIEEEEEESC